MGSAGIHTHTINAAGSHYRTGTIGSAGSHDHTISGGDTESRPVNAYVNWIIKH